MQGEQDKKGKAVKGRVRGEHQRHSSSDAVLSDGSKSDNEVRAKEFLKKTESRLLKSVSRMVSDAKAGKKGDFYFPSGQTVLENFGFQNIDQVKHYYEHGSDASYDLDSSFALSGVDVSKDLMATLIRSACATRNVGFLNDLLNIFIGSETKRKSKWLDCLECITDFSESNSLSAYGIVLNSDLRLAPGSAPLVGLNYKEEEYFFITPSMEARLQLSDILQDYYNRAYDEIRIDYGYQGLETLSTNYDLSTNYEDWKANQARSRVSEALAYPTLLMRQWKEDDNSTTIENNAHDLFALGVLNAYLDNNRNIIGRLRKEIEARGGDDKAPDAVEIISMIESHVAGMFNTVLDAVLKGETKTLSKLQLILDKFPNVASGHAKIPSTNVFGEPVHDDVDGSGAQSKRKLPLPLYRAMQANEPQLVKLLCKYDISPEAEGAEQLFPAMLEYAIQSEDLEITETLITKIVEYSPDSINLDAKLRLNQKDSVDGSGASKTIKDLLDTNVVMERRGPKHGVGIDVISEALPASLVRNKERAGVPQGLRLGKHIRFAETDSLIRTIRTAAAMKEDLWIPKGLRDLRNSAKKKGASRDVKDRFEKLKKFFVKKVTELYLAVLHQDDKKVQQVFDGLRAQTDKDIQTLLKGDGLDAFKNALVNFPVMTKQLDVVNKDNIIVREQTMLSFANQRSSETGLDVVRAMLANAKDARIIETHRDYRASPRGKSTKIRDRNTTTFIYPLVSRLQVSEEAYSYVDKIKEKHSKATQGAEDTSIQEIDADQFDDVPLNDQDEESKSFLGSNDKKKKDKKSQEDPLNIYKEYIREDKLRPGSIDRTKRVLEDYIEKTKKEISALSIYYDRAKGRRGIKNELRGVNPVLDTMKSFSDLKTFHTTKDRLKRNKRDLEHMMLDQCYRNYSHDHFKRVDISDPEVELSKDQRQQLSINKIVYDIKKELVDTLFAGLSKDVEPSVLNDTIKSRLKQFFSTRILNESKEGEKLKLSIQFDAIKYSGKQNWNSYLKDHLKLGKYFKEYLAKELKAIKNNSHDDKWTQRDIEYYSDSLKSRSKDYDIDYLEDQQDYLAQAFTGEVDGKIDFFHMIREKMKDFQCYSSALQNVKTKGYSSAKKKLNHFDMIFPILMHDPDLHMGQRKAIPVEGVEAVAQNQYLTEIKDALNKNKGEQLGDFFEGARNAASISDLRDLIHVHQMNLEGSDQSTKKENVKKLKALINDLCIDGRSDAVKTLLVFFPSIEPIEKYDALSNIIISSKDNADSKKRKKGVSTLNDEYWTDLTLFAYQLDRIRDRRYTFALEDVEDAVRWIKMELNAYIDSDGQYRSTQALRNLTMYFINHMLPGVKEVLLKSVSKDRLEYNRFTELRLEYLKRTQSGATDKKKSARKKGASVEFKVDSEGVDMNFGESDEYFKLKQRIESNIFFQFQRKHANYQQDYSYDEVMKDGDLESLIFLKPAHKEHKHEISDKGIIALKSKGMFGKLADKTKKIKTDIKSKIHKHGTQSRKERLYAIDELFCDIKYIYEKREDNIKEEDHDAIKDPYSDPVSDSDLARFAVKDIEESKIKSDPFSDVSTKLIIQTTDEYRLNKLLKIYRNAVLDRIRENKVNGEWVENFYISWLFSDHSHTQRENVQNIFLTFVECLEIAGKNDDKSVKKFVDKVTKSSDYNYYRHYTEFQREIATERDGFVPDSTDGTAWPQVRRKQKTGTPSDSEMGFPNPTYVKEEDMFEEEEKSSKLKQKVDMVEIDPNSKGGAIPRTTVAEPGKKKGSDIKKTSTNGSKQDQVADFVPNKASEEFINGLSELEQYVRESINSLACSYTPEQGCDSSLFSDLVNKAGKFIDNAIIVLRSSTTTEEAKGIIANFFNRYAASSIGSDASLEELLMRHTLIRCFFHSLLFAGQEINQLGSQILGGDDMLNDIQDSLNRYLLRDDDTVKEIDFVCAFQDLFTNECMKNNRYMAKREKKLKDLDRELHTDFSSFEFPSQEDSIFNSHLRNKVNGIANNIISISEGARSEGTLTVDTPLTQDITDRMTELVDMIYDRLHSGQQLESVARDMITTMNQLYLGIDGESSVSASLGLSILAQSFLLAIKYPNTYSGTEKLNHQVCRYVETLYNLGISHDKSKDEEVSRSYLSRVVKESFYNYADHRESKIGKKDGEMTSDEKFQKEYGEQLNLRKKDVYDKRVSKTIQSLNTQINHMNGIFNDALKEYGSNMKAIKNDLKWSQRFADCFKKSRDLMIVALKEEKEGVNELAKFVHNIFGSLVLTNCDHAANLANYIMSFVYISAIDQAKDELEDLGCEYKEPWRYVKILLKHNPSKIFAMLLANRESSKSLSMDYEDDLIDNITTICKQFDCLDHLHQLAILNHDEPEKQPEQAAEALATQQQSFSLDQSVLSQLNKSVIDLGEALYVKLESYCKAETKDKYKISDFNANGNNVELSMAGGFIDTMRELVQNSTSVDELNQVTQCIADTGLGQTNYQDANHWYSMLMARSNSLRIWIRVLKKSMGSSETLPYIKEALNLANDQKTEMDGIIRESIDNDLSVFWGNFKFAVNDKYFKDNTLRKEPGRLLAQNEAKVDSQQVQHHVDQEALAKITEKGNDKDRDDEVALLGDVDNPQQAQDTRDSSDKSKSEASVDTTITDQDAPEKGKAKKKGLTNVVKQVKQVFSKKGKDKDKHKEETHIPLLDDMDNPQQAQGTHDSGDDNISRETREQQGKTVYEPAAVVGLNTNLRGSVSPDSMLIGGEQPTPKASSDQKSAVLVSFQPATNKDVDDQKKSEGSGAVGGDDELPLAKQDDSVEVLKIEDHVSKVKDSTGPIVIGTDLIDFGEDITGMQSQSQVATQALAPVAVEVEAKGTTESDHQGVKRVDSVKRQAEDYEKKIKENATGKVKDDKSKSDDSFKSRG